MFHSCACVLGFLEHKTETIQRPVFQKHTKLKLSNCGSILKLQKLLSFFKSASFPSTLIKSIGGAYVSHLEPLSLQSDLPGGGIHNRKFFCRETNMWLLCIIVSAEAIKMLHSCLNNTLSWWKDTANNANSSHSSSAPHLKWQQESTSKHLMLNVGGKTVGILNYSCHSCYSWLATQIPKLVKQRCFFHIFL